jgi:hypothetical protein
MRDTLDMTHYLAAAANVIPPILILDAVLWQMRG